MCRGYGGVLMLPASGLEGAEPAFPLSRAEVSQEGAGMHWTVCLGGKREKGIELRGQRELSERDRPHETSSLLRPRMGTPFPCMV